ncbi:MAG: hypothetical protein ACKOVB_01810, partial [Terrabacter sp.]
MRRPVAAPLAGLLAAALLALSACGGGSAGPGADRSATQPAPSASTDEAADGGGTQEHGGHYAEPARSKPLRAGETRTTIAMPGSYTPSA